MNNDYSDIKQVELEEALILKNVVFLDVRSPKEYVEDHIPQAVNLPVLGDIERHLVGYTYKQVSKEKALEDAKKFFEKKLGDIENKIKEFEGKTIIFYCFRGGLRSAAITEHVSKIRKKVYQLRGGYKSYRESVRKELENISLPKNVFVLNGYTGTGKTALLKKLENSVDLEGLAQHRSSMFGGVGLKPRSQKMFESLLLVELKQKRPYLVLEGESRKIGNLMIPEKLFLSMQKGINILISMRITKRAERLLKEYFKKEDDIEEIKDIMPKLKSKISNAKYEECLSLINKKEYLGFCKELLGEYYDPLYEHSIKSLAVEKKINCSDLNKIVFEIESFLKTY
ncbi:tRNA 2-selenouridine(34) synthase MnmH [Candidatus Woesearchaeota archaeon]|nr:tRNA 2-selenouridine(34) synthase MnmH [Candidatus Woesearchaeota archaeon]